MQEVSPQSVSVVPLAMSTIWLIRTIVSHRFRCRVGLASVCWTDLDAAEARLSSQTLSLSVKHG